MHGAPNAVDPPRAPMLESLCTMVSVVKWLRRQVVALEIEGSNPFAHPTALQTPRPCPV